MQIIKPKRGMLNAAAVTSYREDTERELTTQELRLLPYIQHVVTNGGELDNNKVNDQEMQILRELDAAGFVYLKRVEGRVGQYTLATTSSYWFAICRVMLISYVVQAVR